MGPKQEPEAAGHAQRMLALPECLSGLLSSLELEELTLLKRREALQEHLPEKARSRAWCTQMRSP